MRSTDIRRSSLRSLGLLLSGGVLAALVIFHLLLFVERLRDLSILRPMIASQWVGAVLLLVFLGYLARRGRSLVAGRSGLAFWLLVLLLHIVPHVPAPLVDGGDLLLALPSTWIALSFGFLAWVGSRGDGPAPVAEGRFQATAPKRHGPRSGFAPSLLARPPPFVLS